MYSAACDTAGLQRYPVVSSYAMRHRFFFLFILTITSPLRLLPYSAIHRLGQILGLCIYYLFPKYRKRTLSNLALASSLTLSETQMKHLAKASLQNLAITCLEYPKFASEKDIHRVATCENPEEADRWMKQQRPVIFFCGHQANWEVLFLEGTSRMPGVAIGRPIKNHLLYHWILKTRQKYGGKIITPRNAIREGLRALKKGSFLGIVGDQGMPDSGYSSPFFGRSAWTSPIAAVLSYRTGSPIIVATTRRDKGKYFIRYSEPLWPSTEAPLEQEVDRLMKASLALLEASIMETPGQWLWSHNRWKQQTPEKIKRKFRHESILIILPQERELFQTIMASLSAFREIYPHEFISVFTPQQWAHEVILEKAEILSYRRLEELLLRDFRFKLVFNFTSFKKIKPHFKGLSAFEVVSLQELQPFSSDTLKRVLLREGQV